MKYIIKKKGFYFPTEKTKENSLAPQDIYKKAQEEGIDYWANLAKEGIDWIKPFTKTYERNPNSFSWFKNSLFLNKHG